MCTAERQTPQQSSALSFEISASACFSWLQSQHADSRGDCCSCRTVLCDCLLSSDQGMVQEPSARSEAYPSDVVLAGSSGAGQAVPSLVSGAGHDAVALAELTKVSFARLCPALGSTACLHTCRVTDLSTRCSNFQLQPGPARSARPSKQADSSCWPALLKETLLCRWP